MQEEQGNYGIHLEGPVGIDVDAVEVPETAIPDGCSLSEIENIVDPLSNSDESGIDLYLKLSDYILDHLYRAEGTHYFCCICPSIFLY